MPLYHALLPRGGTVRSSHHLSACCPPNRYVERRRPERPLTYTLVGLMVALYHRCAQHTSSALLFSVALAPNVAPIFRSGRVVEWLYHQKRSATCSPRRCTV